ncbi:hypothetical protein AUEXF2481DRAFT_3875 [Aureobasidium subglaciale EXF-2481]|uniref:Uncharacterized protein n=1 Tax=Aureobasidium subglaciale (strain EXF-2481) TaxID=1043005 RepID=A0A074YQI8_AURSE|nr:uncharacterized protein AUEXF2481DRAFT_3875 [Aureobasidium subglaciale EXF-2481]KAI5223621.1 hypothetical protein E4T41_06004 [Aureobasidium subglaciale]KEQ96362.1 hypothetical protein AUEXF2481DRAFT_3875 [Aureobasidium subglaciale EXF-2481]
MVVSGGSHTPSTDMPKNSRSRHKKYQTAPKNSGWNAEDTEPSARAIRSSRAIGTGLLAFAQTLVTAVFCGVSYDKMTAKRTRASPGAVRIW